MSTLPLEFVSCDWGTSNFRLRHVVTETLEVLSGHSTGMGAGKLHQQIENDGCVNRFECFLEYLTGELGKLATLDAWKETVTVISGMASSSIGMQELAYSPMPFDASGDTLISRKIAAGKWLSLILVSGVQTDDDVMRGEEIQALGLTGYLPRDKNGILLLPGTHSKHIAFTEGQFQDFRTFMTGELYVTLSSQGILKNSISTGPWSERHTDVFLDGVSRGADNLAGSLFRIRAKDLLGQLSKEENFHFLSGLLIGSELGYLSDSNDPVFLAAPVNIYDPYRLALEALLSPGRVTCLEDGALEKAVLIGHKIILQSHT